MFTFKFAEKIRAKFFVAFLVLLINDVKASDNSQFATINIQKITESCSVFQDIRNQMNDQFKKMSQKFDEKAQGIVKRESELSKKQAVMEKGAYNKKIAEVNAQKQQIQSELEKDKQKMQKIYFDAISAVNKTMNDEIKQFAVKKGYKAIFEMSTLVYHDLNDITPDVVGLLNEKLPSYKIDFSLDNKNSKSDVTIGSKENLDDAVQKDLPKNVEEKK